MFTGIVTAIGTIREATQKGDLHAVIGCPWDPAGIAIGASIACSGTCLTVVERGGTAGDAWFAVDISAESVACTVPGRWVVGGRLNLEPALRLGDELGGHIVTGHVDGVGEVVGVCPEGDSRRIGSSEHRVAVNHQGAASIDGQRRRTGRAHRCDRRHADHRHVEPHVLARFGDLHHTGTRTGQTPGSLNRLVRTFHRFDGYDRAILDDDGLADVETGDRVGHPVAELEVVRFLVRRRSLRQRSSIRHQRGQ